MSFISLHTGKLHKKTEKKKIKKIFMQAMLVNFPET